MKFTVLERIVLLNLFPAEGDFRSMKIISDFKKELGFSEDDLKILKFKELPNGQTSWQPGLEDKEINIGPATKELIRVRLRFLDKNEKLGIECISVYEKFIEKDEK